MCMNPLIIRDKSINSAYTNGTISVPCSKCPKCKKAKVNSWLFRLKKQLEISSNPIFLTLTYNDDNLIYTNNGNTTIWKRDVQLFMKRLRKHNALSSTIPLKYYFVGEYGKKSMRPHYHAILLNLQNTDPLIIEKIWGQGFCHVGSLTDDSIRYVLKYISKQKTTNIDDRIPEFSLMSKGMGQNYLTPHMLKWFKNDAKNCYITLPGGIMMSLPKYYKDKIYDSYERFKVNSYLKTRSIILENQHKQKELQKNPQWTEKIIDYHIDISKQNHNFDKRSETL